MKIQHRPPCKSWSGYRSGFPRGGARCSGGAARDREPFPRAFTISRWRTIPHGWMDRLLARSLARSRLRVKETPETVYNAAPRARCTHGTHETRVRSPRSRARHWRAVAPGLLVRGATEQRRDARRHPRPYPHPSAKGAATSHPAVRRGATHRGRGRGRGRGPTGCAPPSMSPPRLTMPAIGTPGARTVNQKNVR